MRSAERVRRQLLAETGMDFGRFRPSPTALMTTSGADVGIRLTRDVLVSLLTGLGLAIVVGLVSAWMGVSGVSAFASMLAASLLGLGLAAWMMSGRLFRRIPEEVDAVFQVAADLARDASGQIEKLAGSAEQIVRGLVMVSALPAVATAVSRRFLVLAPVVRPLVEGLLARIVDRGMPTVTATMPDAVPRVREIATGVVASRDRVIGRAMLLVRWGLFPLRVAGVVALSLGFLLLVAGWIIRLA